MPEAKQLRRIQVSNLAFNFFPKYRFSFATLSKFLRHFKISARWLTHDRLDLGSVVALSVTKVVHTSTRFSVLKAPSDEVFNRFRCNDALFVPFLLEILIMFIIMRH